jgi:uncharacterized HAD superfamily protein
MTGRNQGMFRVVNISQFECYLNITHTNSIYKHIVLLEYDDFVPCVKHHMCQIYMSCTTELNYVATISFLLAIALSVLRFTVSDYSSYRQTLV